MNFFELYKSFDYFYDSILRGNEIEFLYKEKQYYILPHFDKSCVIGVCFGEAYSDDEKIYFSFDELYNAPIENTTFDKILNEIEIKFYAFN